MANLEESVVQRPNSLATSVSAGILATMAALALPVAEQPWGEREWFIGIFLACVVLLNGLTALLLALHVGASRRDGYLAWLGGGYAFTAVMAALQLLTFPGLLRADGGGASADQAAVWLWLLWHGGLPLFVLLAMGRVLAQLQASEEGAPPRHGSLEPVFIGLLSGLAFGLLVVNLEDRLPQLIDADRSYRALSDGLVGQILVLLNMTALGAVAYATRLRSITDQWLALALLAFSLDILLSLVGGARYSAGWYMARVMSLLAAGALLVALMVEHFRLLRAAQDRAEALDDLAHRDALTGLFNRRYLEAHLTYEFQRAKRYGHNLSVLMIDLDHFKAINDRYGHAAGDECLKAVAGVLQAHIKRSGEFVARYGGEEFAVVLPESRSAAAKLLAEDIRRDAAALHEQHRSPHALTISIGVATSNPREVEQTFDNLLHAADSCLYQAKRDGRNRVVGMELGFGPLRPPLRIAR